MPRHGGEEDFDHRCRGLHARWRPARRAAAEEFGTYDEWCRLSDSPTNGGWKLGAAITDYKRACRTRPGVTMPNEAGIDELTLRTFPLG